MRSSPITCCPDRRSADAPATWDIRPLQRTEIPLAGRALALACWDYVLYQYFFGLRVVTPTRFQAFMTGFVELMMDYKHVYCSDRPEQGLAMFLPPAVFDIPTLKALLFSVRKAPSAGLSHLLRMLPISDELNLKRPLEPHWYVMLIGVAPDAQRQGLGRCLMRHALRQADVAAQPMYLETAARSNVAFYADLGFQLQGQFRCHEGRGPEIWRMLRQAQSLK